MVKLQTGVAIRRVTMTRLPFPEVSGPALHASPSLGGDGR